MRSFGFSRVIASTSAPDSPESNSGSGTAAALGGRRAAGALLFTCTGRGSRLFAEPDHDAGLVAKTLGEIPLAGFFCDGELGPVGGQNFLHTFTASLALFPETAR